MSIQLFGIDIIYMGGSMKSILEVRIRRGRWAGGQPEGRRKDTLFTDRTIASWMACYPDQLKDEVL